MLYTIGEMAKTLGVPTSTLRFYERRGLLPFVERSKGGMRMFTDKDYETLQIIACLKDSGLSIQEIASFIDMAQRGDETIDERCALFHHRKAEVERQMEQLRATQHMLEYKCWYYETAKAAGTTAVPENMALDDVPEEFWDVRRQLTAEEKAKEAVDHAMQV